MDTILKNLSDSKIVILSGEGDIGTYERYKGKRSAGAIKSRLTKERCNGDRWARAYIESDPNSSVYLDLELPENMRHINMRELD